jgi:hypothetical protein
MDFLVSILLGLGLSAAVGFRIFVPALITSIAAYYGKIELAESMQWFGSLPAMVTFGVATVLEIAGYYVPFVDNLLDTVSAPMAAVCGSLLMGSTIVDMDPVIKWPVSVIAGGGLAATIQGGTSLVRLKSSGFTGGMANPVVSSAEAGFAGIISIISIFMPIAAGLVIMYLIYRIIKRKVIKRNEKEG